jgi:hypothetical protein
MEDREGAGIRGREAKKLQALEPSGLGRYRAYLRTLAELEPRGAAGRQRLDASDIVQEMLLKACQALEQLKGQRQSTWRAGVDGLFAARWIDRAPRAEERYLFLVIFLAVPP